MIYVFIKGQYYPYQGYVIISENSLIRDAANSVFLESGGVINTTQSEFLNNYNSIWFDPYGYTIKPNPINASVIRENDFIIDSILHPTTLTGTDRTTENGIQVRLSSISGLSILGNNFDYQFVSLIRYRNAAIMSINSNLVVDDYSSSQSKISSFYYGVRADGSSNSLHLLKVLNTDFKGNLYSVKCAALLTPSILSNTFNRSAMYTSGTGVYLDACDQYNIKFNTFKNGNYGAYIRNSGENYNLLYKNDFDSVTYPAIANLRNSDFDTDDEEETGFYGLELKCNDFEHFSYAISVTGNMQRHQGQDGTSQQLAGNRFYPVSSTNQQREFCVSTSIHDSIDMPYYNYYHHNETLCIPDWRTVSKVTLNPMPEDFIENDACPDNPGAKSSTKSTGSLFVQYIELNDSINFVMSDKETELQQIVDNGNTLLLKMQASMMNDANYAETIEALELEGLLSDEVVLELMQNTMAPDAAKTIALINNSPLPQKGKDKIDEMTDVDEDLREILKQYQTGKNAREIKENEIRTLKNEKKKNISNLIKYVANEDNPDLRNLLVEFLESQNTFEDYKLALRFSLADNNYHKADELLYDLSQVSQTMSINKKIETENYIHLQTIAINVELNNEFSDSIINSNSEFLFAMANDTLIVESAQAQVLLEIAGLAEYTPVVYPPVVDNTKSLVFTETLPNKTNKITSHIKIYPNPVKENLFVEYFVFDFENSVEKTIYLFSESGEIINSFKITKDFEILTINTRNLAPGVYLIKLNDCVEKFTKM
jgi:hypothetical protein